MWGQASSLSGGLGIPLCSVGTGFQLVPYIGRGDQST